MNRMKLDFNMTRLMEILKIYPEGLAFDKLLHDKGFDIFKNRKCDGYQEGLASIVIIF